MSGSNLTFSGNRADRLGGAIYVQTSPNQIEPRLRLNGCFLQSGVNPFKDRPPQNWVSRSDSFVCIAQVNPRSDLLCLLNCIYFSCY